MNSHLNSQNHASKMWLNNLKILYLARKISKLQLKIQNINWHDGNFFFFTFKINVIETILTEDSNQEILYTGIRTRVKQVCIPMSVIFIK